MNEGDMGDSNQYSPQIFGEENREGEVEYGVSFSKREMEHLRNNLMSHLDIYGEVLNNGRDEGKISPEAYASMTDSLGVPNAVLRKVLALVPSEPTDKEEIIPNDVDLKLILSKSEIDGIYDFLINPAFFNALREQNASSDENYESDVDFVIKSRSRAVLKMYRELEAQGIEVDPQRIELLTSFSS